jgi:hypothetical protein
LAPRLPAAEPERPTVNEIEVTSRARRALLDQPQLRPLNLFVRVQAGVATLEGPVPSAEVGRLAIGVLQEVRGVYEVRNRLYLRPAEQPKPFTIPLAPEPVVKSQSASPDPKTTNIGTLAGRTPGPDSPLHSAVTLLPPVALVGPSPPLPPAPADQLQARVDSVRRSEPRFVRLVAEVRDAATIWVLDDPYRGEDVAAFVAALRQLPGVQSVVLRFPSR